jgi:hypothetical protein
MCGCKKKKVQNYKYTSPTGQTRTYSSEAEARLKVAQKGGTYTKVS